MNHLPADAARRPSKLLPALLAAALLAAPAAPAWAGCHGLQLHAHRGAPGGPENSLSAVQQAWDGAWDGAEIDVQTLRDGQWVLHHDLKLGRTTSLQGRATTELPPEAWREVRMKDRQGRLVAEAAPFLADLTTQLPARDDKVLNIELKQLNLSCQAAEGAAQGLSRSRARRALVPHRHRPPRAAVRAPRRPAGLPGPDRAGPAGPGARGARAGPGAGAARQAPGARPRLAAAAAAGGGHPGGRARGHQHAGGQPGAAGRRAGAGRAGVHLPPRAGPRTRGGPAAPGPRQRPAAQRRHHRRHAAAFCDQLGQP